MSLPLLLGRRRPVAAVVLAALAVLPACGPADSQDGGTQSTPESSPAMTTRAPTNLAERLANGQSIFGIFSGERTADQGRTMGANRDLDFVFYSLEQGPFDLETMGAYMEGVAGGSGSEGAHPMALRIPPIRDGVGEAEARVAEALGAGVSAIVFPHVQSGEDAAIAVSSMGSELWPANPEGTLVNMLIIEDREAVPLADEIVSTPGVSVVFAGPGDLRRSYEGDMEAVEGAIQTVLTACQAHGVPCGITAGPDDIATRLEQGFRVIIVSDAEAVPIGRGAAGR